MKILVINSGSSSIKYKLFDMTCEKVLASGLVEKIGEGESYLTHKIITEDGEDQKIIKGRIADHYEGLMQVVNLLIHPEYGVVKDKAEISLIGHRVVHGGESFKAPTIINKEVIAKIRNMIPLAPLHNPSNLAGIEIARSMFPDAQQVAIFDTAFHQTIPKKAYIYAIPYYLYKKHGVRRYGFHGTSHSYVSEKASEYLNRSLSGLNVITIHLGNGASMAALKNGKCVDTSMGMTPLEGLVMGTRAGDIDPAIPFFLSNHLKMSLDEIDNLLNKESGLKGICGINDMREVLEKSRSGDEMARLALDVYTYRIKKYIGAYYAVLGGLDILIFTGGIGENSSVIRASCCHGLNKLGIEIDAKKNNLSRGEVWEISISNSEAKVLVVQTDEELKIARETKRVMKNIAPIKHLKKI